MVGCEGDRLLSRVAGAGWPVPVVLVRREADRE